MIPITLVGTGDLMPNAKEYLLYPGKVTVSGGRLDSTGFLASRAGAQRRLQPSAKACLPARQPWRLQVVIHPAIQPKDATAMTEEAHAAIASSLPPELVAPPEEEVGSSVDSS